MTTNETSVDNEDKGTAS
ncbi:unnamed protein product, partial [Rotaria sp. Silwood2]